MVLGFQSWYGPAGVWGYMTMQLGVLGLRCPLNCVDCMLPVTLFIDLANEFVTLSASF